MQQVFNEMYPSKSNLFLFLPFTNKKIEMRRNAAMRVDNCSLLRSGCQFFLEGLLFSVIADLIT